MLFNGKEVLTPDTFDYSSAKPGDYVAQQVVDNAINCLPPACMTRAYVQMGEPYSQQHDPVAGRWRSTYATFRRVTEDQDGIWQYCGHCFPGETVEGGCG